MKKSFIVPKIEKVTYIIEMVIAVSLAVGVCLGLIDLVKYFTEILHASPAESYELFEAFLGYALVLIVGVELILMILYHSTKAILELVLFVIARKMLIYSHTMVDLVLGTIAIAMIFVILKYLFRQDEEDIVLRESNIYSAEALVKDVVDRTGLDLPLDKARTLGGLVCSLSDEICKPVTEGAVYHTGDIRIKVIKAMSNGFIEEVKITDKKNEGRAMERRNKKALT